MRRFFRRPGHVIGADHPVIAEKLRRASSHRTRYTHETRVLGRGAELTTVRDNQRHASIATTTIYLRATVWSDKSGFAARKIAGPHRPNVSVRPHYRDLSKGLKRPLPLPSSRS